MKRILIFHLLALLAANFLYAQEASVAGPDSLIQLTFSLRDGRPMYTVSCEGRQVLDESPLGFVADNGDFSSHLQLVGFDTLSPLEYSYALTRSKTSQVHVKANVLKVNLENADKLPFSIEFRLTRHDIAFRYCIPCQPSKTNGKRFSTHIMKETTGFRFPSDTRTFLTPQAIPCTGWKGTKPSYEEEYVFDEPMSTPSRYGCGYTFPALFRVPFELPPTKKDKSPRKDFWVLVSETGVDGKYCASRLSDHMGNGLYSLLFPLPEENGGCGTVEPAFALPGHTPWRTLTIGSSLRPIVETTIPWDFVEPRYTTSHNYQFGRGTWSWILWQDESICFEDQKRYIDLAREMNFQFVLIDNWWDTRIGRDKIEELVQYAQKQGIGVFLWYSSSGWWNDIEQGPINIMSDPVLRKQYMRWMQSIGVKGIKVDFFGGDKQETMRHYEQILSDADDSGLMVIFHGCTIPRGWERMYPNYVGSEAVLSSENLIFEQHFCDEEARNTALHPFLRNTIGCMEFGGCMLNRHLHRGNKGGHTRRTTDAHELATTVLFQNPIQNFAVAPENLGDQGDNEHEYNYNAEGAYTPRLCLDYLREVPTTWDETRFIDGYPGRYIVLARRSGDLWYIAGNNATGGELRLTLSLPMLSKGTSTTLYSDNLLTREPQRTTFQVKNPNKVTISMADQGGFVIIQKEKVYR